MKKNLTAVLLFACIIALPSVVTGQTIGGFYRLKVDHLLHESDINGNIAGFVNKTLPAFSKFTVINKTAAGDWVVRFWNWGGSSNMQSVLSAPAAPSITTNSFIPGITVAPNANQLKIASFNIYQNAAGSWQQRYFIITSGEFTLFTEEVQSTWTPAVGVATLPFKFRPITHEFTKDLSISGLAGIKHNGLFGRLPATSWSTLVGIGVASVTLNSDNTNGQLTKASDFAAISLCIGEVMEWKKLQIGVFAGWDSVQKADRNGWVNQGNIWFGFGIGFSIFAESSPGTEGKNH